jgi:hypothetical protein
MGRPAGKKSGSQKVSSRMEYGVELKEGGAVNGKTRRWK